MEYLRNQIISEIQKHALFFAILADETTDTLNNEQLCISIRFVDDTCSIHEELLRFVRLGRTTGAAVATSFLEALQTWSLDVKIAKDKDMMELLVCPRLQEVRKHLLDKRTSKQSINTSMHTA